MLRGGGWGEGGKARGTGSGWRRLKTFSVSIYICIFVFVFLRFPLRSLVLFLVCELLLYFVAYLLDRIYVRILDFSFVIDQKMVTKL
jgi:hypothetical protein